jgi:hypothetical protein
MTHKIITIGDQLIAINAVVNGGKTFAEFMAEAVSRVEGAERDNATREAVAVISKLDDFFYSQYETHLAKTMGISDRELRKMVKAAMKVKDKEDLGENVEYILSGYIKGWLVDYLYDPDEGNAVLCWKDPNGKVDSGRSVKIDDKKFAAMPPNQTITTGAVLFPSALGPSKSTLELAKTIEMYINRVYLLPNKLFAKIMSYFVLLTWVYDSFPAIPYLRVTGEPGSGKSELMLRIALLCYRRFVASGASSTASLFRMVDKYKGTVFMDEMDLQKSDASADIVKFLVQGAMADGAPIIRCEEVMVDGEKKIQEIIFPVYCPKLLAMQGDFFDKAVGSRCLTFPIQPRETYELVDAGIPLSINDQMRNDAKAIRNLLIRWRLEHWEKGRQINPNYYNLNITARLNQVTVAIQMLAEGEPELQKEISGFMEEYHRFLTQDKNMTTEARIIEAMWKIYKYPELHRDWVEREADGRERMKIGQITKIANDIIREMNMEDDAAEDTKVKKDALSPQKTGRRIREKLQLETSERARNGYSVYWDERHMIALSKRFGVNPDDFGPTEGVKETVTKVMVQEEISIDKLPVEDLLEEKIDLPIEEPEPKKSVEEQKPLSLEDL